MKNNAIRQAIEHHVDGLRMPEEAMHAILQKAKEDCPVKRKTSLMLVAVIVLLLGAATALAVTALHDQFHAVARDCGRDLGFLPAVMDCRALANSLSAALPGIPKESIQQAIADMGLPAAVRGEQLTLEDFAALSAALGREADGD